MNKTLEEAYIEPHFIDGMRVTDEHTLKVAITIEYNYNYTHKYN